jgi:hypothetical protein
MATHSESWMSIAEQVTDETNPAKLAILVKQLCCALDNRGIPEEDQTKNELEQILTAYPGVRIVGWM